MTRPIIDIYKKLKENTMQPKKEGQNVIVNYNMKQKEGSRIKMPITKLFCRISISD